MAITIRSKREIELLRNAGKVVADVLSKIQEAVKPGVSTGELDELAIQIAKDASARTLFKGVQATPSQRPFPGAICASINEQIVHGIPSRKNKVKSGDILSVDFGVQLAGYCGDAAITIPIGEVSDKKQKLLDVTKKVLDIAIKKMTPGLKWSEIASEMEACVKEAGFSVVKDLVGHGIGTDMWEDPKLPNYVSADLRRNDIFLKEGMILAVEPMVNVGVSAIKTLSDGWTIATKDSKDSAHFEHTIAIVKSGCKVLTA